MNFVVNTNLATKKINPMSRDVTQQGERIKNMESNIEKIVANHESIEKG